MAVPGSGGASVLPASFVLDSGAYISRIPESVLKQVGVRPPDVQVSMTLKGGSRNVRFANGLVVAVTRETIALQLMVHTPWDPVIPDSDELFAVMLCCDSAVIVERMTHKKPGLNLNSSMFQPAQVRRAMPVSASRIPTTYLVLRSLTWHCEARLIVKSSCVVVVAAAGSGGSDSSKHE